jgi:hypothetical protein
MLAGFGCLAVGDEVDESSPDEEGEEGADEAGEEEEANTVDFPVVWSYRKGQCGG